MNVKKVAIFTHGIRRGPFEKLSTALARGFEELGVSCDLIVLSASDAEKAKYPDVNVLTLETPRAAFSLLPLIRYIRAEKPEAIFSMPWYFNVLAIWARYLSGINTQNIIGEHNICSLESKIEHGDKLQTKYLPLLMRYTYPHGDGLIGVSKDTITDLTQEMKVPLHMPTSVIPNPIDIHRIRQLSQETVNHAWLQNRDIPVILTVARLAKQKQLNVLINAFARVLKVLPAKLLILGEGPLRAELEGLCRELHLNEHVSMPGYDHNPYRLMSACDVFVLASAWEGCPVALEEALACGAAVIVNDGPGGAKDVINYGKYGLMVPAGDSDPGALAEAMIRILSNPELKIHYQEQARCRAQDFHYLKISQQYLDFCDSVLTANCKKGRSPQ